MANLGYPDPVGILAGERVKEGSALDATLEYRCIYCAGNSLKIKGQSVYVIDTGTRRFVRSEPLPECSEHGYTFVSINSCYANVPGLIPL